MSARCGLRRSEKVIISKLLKLTVEEALDSSKYEELLLPKDNELIPKILLPTVPPQILLPTVPPQLFQPPQPITP